MEPGEANWDSVPKDPCSARILGAIYFVAERPMSSQGTNSTAREEILRLVRALPDDTSYDEILRELAFVRMVDRGLADADGGRKIKTQKLRERVRQWRS